MESRKRIGTRKFFVSVVVLVVIFASMFCYATRVKADECQRGYVKVTTNLNVREDPALKSKVIAKLNPGDIVKIYKEKENFYYITALSDDKIKGYVSKDYVIIPEKDVLEYELESAAVITAQSSSENRNYNMTLACEKINGLTLEPGDKFDWYGENGVGRASKENGFKEATVIQNRKYVKGYGGGVCQVSTAMYNCIYDLDIEPDEIHHHSLQSSYVEKGMDATVVYSSGKNFVFTNTKDYTIEFEAFTENERVIILAYKLK